MLHWGDLREGVYVSELDFYLVVALGCSICGLFIGMGNTLTHQDHEMDHAKQRSDLARVVFALAPVVGMGYLLAWLWVSYQPMFKLIPVFILAVVAGMCGGFLTRNGISPWWPATGVVMMPTMFHVARYLGLA